MCWEQLEELRLGGGGFCRRGASYSSCPSSPAMAIFGPLGAVWCVISARAIATVIRSAMCGAVAVAASSRLPQRVRRCRATTT